MIWCLRLATLSGVSPGAAAAASAAARAAAADASARAADRAASPRGDGGERVGRDFDKRSGERGRAVPARGPRLRRQGGFQRCIG